MTDDADSEAREDDLDALLRSVDPLVTSHGRGQAARLASDDVRDGIIAGTSGAGRWARGSMSWPARGSDVARYRFRAALAVAAAVVAVAGAAALTVGLPDREDPSVATGSASTAAPNPTAQASLSETPEPSEAPAPSASAAPTDLASEPAPSQLPCDPFKFEDRPTTDQPELVAAWTDAVSDAGFVVGDVTLARSYNRFELDCAAPQWLVSAGLPDVAAAASIDLFTADSADLLDGLVCDEDLECTSEEVGGWTVLTIQGGVNSRDLEDSQDRTRVIVVDGLQVFGRTEDAEEQDDAPKEAWSVSAPIEVSPQTVRDLALARAWSQARQTPATEESPSAADVAVARSFVDFAAEPTPERARAVGFADSVALGLGTQILVDVPATSIADPAAWDLDVELFAGYVGPFSALQVLRDDDPDPAGADPVFVGPDYNHCAGPPRPGPPLQPQVSDRLLVLQPGTDQIDSCLNWYAVEVHLDPDGQVSAVVLDLWEP